MDFSIESNVKAYFIDTLKDLGLVVSKRKRMQRA